MSIFNRVAGTEEPKIAVWPLITNMTRVMDGEITLQQLTALHSFSAAEQDEADEYLLHFVTLIQDKALLLQGASIPQTEAIELARSIVDAKVRHALLRCEGGTIDEATFRSNLGLQP